MNIPAARSASRRLFTIAQIYKDDLRDFETAKETFQEFLKRYPGSDLADDAKAAIADIDRPASAKKKSEKDSRGNLKTVQEKQDKPDAKAGRPMVTGIRHWSTPDYTRVAIDLESEVKYEAGRVPILTASSSISRRQNSHPPWWARPSTSVTDFSKKIRIAQFERGTTRVVLEVDDVSDYSAFLLPNPYRLIIDIHGRQPQRTTNVAKNTAAKDRTEARA